MIEEIKSEEKGIIAAFTPSSALGNGTGSDGFDEVSDIAPLKGKHFIWRCLIEGPLLELPLKVSSLVNNGCHLILIRPNVIKKLGLEILHLKPPKPLALPLRTVIEKKRWNLRTM
jgi:hypothetical protein